MALAGSKLNLIAAMGPDREIGLGNKLLWRLPKDMARFKAATLGGTVLMGSATWLSLGAKALPGRKNWVLSRSAEGPGAPDQRAKSLCELEALARQEGPEALWVIGGAQVYELLLPLADELHLTRVSQAAEADTYFPALNFREWALAEREEALDGAAGDIPVAFETWVRDLG